MDTRHQELYLAQPKSNMDSVDRTTLFMLEITSISNRRKDKVLKNDEIKVQGAKNKTIDVQKLRATIICSSPWLLRLYIRDSRCLRKLGEGWVWREHVIYKEGEMDGCTVNST